MQVLCVTLKIHLPISHAYKVDHVISRGVFHSFPALSLGCVLHGSVPLRCFDRSFGPWSHTTWSIRWYRLLPETRLVQTRRGTGIPHVCMSVTNTQDDRSVTQMSPSILGVD